MNWYHSGKAWNNFIGINWIQPCSTRIIPMDKIRWNNKADHFNHYIIHNIIRYNTLHTSYLSGLPTLFRIQRGIYNPLKSIKRLKTNFAWKSHKWTFTILCRYLTYIYNSFLIAVIAVILFCHNTCLKKYNYMFLIRHKAFF